MEMIISGLNVPRLALISLARTSAIYHLKSPLHYKTEIGIQLNEQYSHSIIEFPYFSSECLCIAIAGSLPRKHIRTLFLSISVLLARRSEYICNQLACTGTDKILTHD